MCKKEERRVEPGDHNKHPGWSEKQFVVGLSNSYFSELIWKAHRELSWLDRFTCRALSLQKKKKVSKNSSRVWFGFFFFYAGEITQFYKQIPVSWEQEAKFNSKKRFSLLSMMRMEGRVEGTRP